MELLTNLNFATMHDRIRKMNVPLDAGRIPHKIESSMAKLTADEWKNWTCVYSLFVLHDILPREHLECWWLFVQACRLVCQPTYSLDCIARIDEYLLNFCTSFQHLYGDDACTINLHLHCHITEGLYDYGPAHNTWCFSFERYNGILGMIPYNKQSLQIEKTIIKRFIQQMESFNVNSLFAKELEEFFPTNEAGAVNETNDSSDVCIKKATFSTTKKLTELIFDNSIFKPIGIIATR